MKLISMFEYNDATFVKDSNGNIYSLQFVPKDKWLNLASISTIQKDLNIETNNTSLLTKQIENMLVSLKIPSKFKGFRYLTSCIVLLVENPTYQQNFRKYIYPTVAKIHNTTVTAIDGSITTLAKKTKNCELFSSAIYPVPKDFITTLADYFLEHYKIN